MAKRSGFDDEVVIAALLHGLCVATHHIPFGIITLLLFACTQMWAICTV